jgi:hypothetical protein
MSSFAGSNNIGADFAAAGIGSPPSSEVITDYFVADGNFHLDPTAPRVGELIDRGIDLSADPTLPFDRDIDRSIRVAPWDIGADEH